MKTIGKKVLSVLLAVSFCASLFPVSADSLKNKDSKSNSENKKIICTATLEDDFADDSVIVVINKDYSKINKKFNLSAFTKDTFEDIVDLSVVDGDISEKKYLNKEDFKQILKLNLKKTGKEEVLKAIRKLEKIDWVESAEPNYISQPLSCEEHNLISKTDSIELCSTKPNDFQAANQYALDYMNAPAAWDLETGKKDVRVGVIDTGIYQHEDLKDNLVKGWDFENNNSITDDDINGHGTHAAGIIGAVGNNNIEITGVCWNISLVPLQTSYDSEGNMKVDAVNRAIQYANNNDIPIINCSFGGYEKSNSFEAAMRNYKGLIVCAAGNNNKNTDNNPFYPSSSTLENVISVANFDYRKEGLASNSNYGSKSVDIAACGTNIKSTYKGNTYERLSGTSQAAPFVSATAALMLSYRPDLDAATLKEIILKTGTYNSALKDKVATSRILNIYKAVYEVCKISPPAKAIMGDVDGDGRDDIVSIGKHNSIKHGYVYIQFANSSSGYKSAVCVSTRKNVNYNDDIWLEDINGDGMDDLVCRVGEGQWDTGYIYVALSLKTKFDIWTYNSNGRVVSPYDEILFGDVDGNGKQDIICRGAVTQHDEGKMYTALSYGNGFTFWSYESSSKIVNQGDRLWVGDVNGDKKDDIVCEGDFSKGDAGCIYIALSDGKKFTFWSNKTLIQRLKNVDDKVWVEDVNNDGRADLIVQTGLNAWDTGYIWIALSNVNGFNFWTWHSGAKVVSETDEVMPADINGDGKTDLVVRGGFGKWDAGYIWTALSNGSSFDFWTFHTTYKVVYPRDQILIGKINSDLCDDILTVRGYGYTDAGTMRTAVSNKKSFNFWTWIGGKIGV